MSFEVMIPFTLITLFQMIKLQQQQHSLIILLLMNIFQISPVSATMSSSYAVVSNDIYALTSAYWGLGCVFYQPGGAQMRCPKLACSDILASRTYFTTGWC